MAMDPRGDPLIFTGDGRQVGFDEVVSAASGADVVLIGETHGHELGLAFAAALFEDVLARTDRAALSLEFFERDQQAALDDYLAGFTDEKAFRKAAHRTDGNYPAGHRAMIEAAKAAGRPVYAANAPRRYVRIARRRGFDALGSITPEQSRLVVVPDEQPGGRYRDDFFEMMGEMFDSDAHGQQREELTEEQKQERLEGYFRSQSVWDATMADTIATALADGNRPVVHVVGRFHADFGGGTVQMLRRLRPEARIVTISVGDVRPDGFAEDDRGRADYVVYVGSGSEGDSG